ncbi:MAG TPA: lysophospholipid acyltransferase family protein [Pseudonocardiaceae bacterium]|nr:lysophospholipid acyltransferase family protein [Pseudonocardiaceae bacterium]
MGTAVTPDVPEGTWLWLRDLTRWIGTWCFFVSYRLHMRYLDRMPASGPIVVVANHSAIVDGPLLYGVLGRPTSFLIKQEMFRGPLGWILPRIGQLAVRRGAVDRAPLLTAVRLLRHGGVVVVFPEGTRGVGDVDNAHQGAVWLARTGGARLLPVAIRGTRRPPRSNRRFRPRVDVLFGEPFAVPPGRGRAALVAATNEMRDRLVTLVAELDRIRGRGLPRAIRPKGA